MISRAMLYLKRNIKTAIILGIAIGLVTVAITVSVTAGSMTDNLKSLYSGKGGLSELVLTNIKNISQWLMILVSVSSLIVLGLIFTFWIRSRKHETGVLLALGKPKKEILSQFLIEALVVSVIGISAGLIPGYGISGTFNNILINRAGENAKFGSEANRTGVSQEKNMIKSEGSYFGVRELAKIYAVSGGTVIFSTFIGLNSFLMKTPKKIQLEEDK